MYGLLWRKLPGNWFTKFLGCAVLFLGVTAVLFLVVFPYIDPKLPWNHVAIGAGGEIHALMLTWLGR